MLLGPISAGMDVRNQQNFISPAAAELARPSNWRGLSVSRNQYCWLSSSCQTIHSAHSPDGRWVGPIHRSFATIVASICYFGLLHVILMSLPGLHVINLHSILLLSPCTRKDWISIDSDSVHLYITSVFASHDSRITSSVLNALYIAAAFKTYLHTCSNHVHNVHCGVHFRLI